MRLHDRASASCSLGLKGIILDIQVTPDGWDEHIPLCLAVLNQEYAGLGDGDAVTLELLAQLSVVLQLALETRLRRHG